MHGSAGDNKNAQLTVLFEEWAGSGEDWNSSELVVQMKHSRRHTKRGCRKWLTRQQLIDKYHSAETADDIIQHKLDNQMLSKTQVRWHPDLPAGNLEMRQFLVFDSAEEVDESDEVLESLLKLKDSDDPEPKSRKRGRSPEKKKKKSKKNKKNKKRSSSSSSSSSQSSSSSSSDSTQASAKTGKTSKTSKNKKDKKEKKEKPEKPDVDPPKELTEKEKEKERKRLEKEEQKRQKAAAKEHEREQKKQEALAKREEKKAKDQQRAKAKKEWCSRGFGLLILDLCGWNKLNMNTCRISSRTYTLMDNVLLFFSLFQWFAKLWCIHLT